MRFRVGIVVLALIFAAAPAAAKDRANAYVGVAKCARCQEKELYGDQVSAWRKGPHAKALETLGSEKAAEYAKERGISGSPQYAAERLKCHVTAYGVDGRLVKYELEPADGVQCESWHGPGSNGVGFQEMIGANPFKYGIVAGARSGATMPPPEAWLSYRLVSAVQKTQLGLPSIGSERKAYFPFRPRFFDPGVCSRSGWTVSSRDVAFMVRSEHRPNSFERLA